MILRRRGLGPVHAHQAGVAVGVDGHVLSRDVPMGDLGPVEAGEVGPGVVEHGVVDSVDVELGEAFPRGVADDQQGVVPGPSDPDGDQARNPSPAALGQEQDQGLVLDLLAAAEGHRRAGVLVPDEAPDLGEQTGVGAVATDDLHGQRVVAVGHEGGVAPGLLGVQADAVVR